MYNVDTNRIEEVLAYMERSVELLRGLAAREDAQLMADPVAMAAAERGLHLSLEAIADVGNALIDGFIMRDPGSYADIVEILRDERVIDDAEAKVLTDVVAFRKQLVIEYTQVPALDMLRLIRSSLDTLAQFPVRVRSYLKAELF
ncbi:DUF86 domain-containing protein [Brevibacillus massiliensis]|uniref:DUF86 domain-containing protein n=1 Tax=Brevibacillus massiliensis TaxID=1118054 RepID=UPI000367F4EB|nr:DUF86 domain-containing protein [Brevibacillus massiliensis]